MSDQGIFFTALVVFLSAVLPPGARAACFDFNRDGIETHAGITDRVSRALKAPADGEEPVRAASGRLPSGFFWAAAREKIERPLPGLMQELLKHEATRSPRASQMRVFEAPDPRFWRHQRVLFTVHPFPLVNVEWTEDWFFSLSSGRLPVGRAWYEKTEGTSHIAHLCGLFEVTQTGPSASEVALYEEAGATGRDEESSLSSVRGTLERLRRDLSR
jgi:hypothetical protein